MKFIFITKEIKERTLKEIGRRLDSDKPFLKESLEEILLNVVTAIQLEEELKSMD